MSMTIAAGRWVTLRYRISDAQGEPIETGERELTYLHGGYGAVLPGIEHALEGHGAGHAATVELEPENAFGDYDVSLVHLAPRAGFPDDLEAGMGFQKVPGMPELDGDGNVYIATEFTDDTVVLDGNHPLAGMALRFELKVMSVAQATDEEIERERLLAEDDEG